jgi:methylmalonyl-CoA/ethylmalonyl-CoA epimerase
MSRVNDIAHVGIAVESVDKAIAVFLDYFGGELVYKKEIPDQKQISAMFSVAGQFNLELMEPTDENAVVAKHIKNRGQGIHHISLKVEDLPGLVEHLERKGAVIIGKSLEGKNKFAFIHPKSTFGVLVELSEKE